MRLEYQNNDQVVLFTYNPDRNDAIGSFDENNEKIYINARLTKLEREIVYFHEITHKECFEAKCICWKKKSGYLCEYHAFRGTLRRVVDARNHLRSRFWQKLRKCYLREVEKALRKYSGDLTVWKTHLKALRKLMKTKAFKELSGEID